MADSPARVCVYCGSGEGHDPEHAALAEALGAALARARVELVYGGGRIGLMGRLADAALAHGGTVTGVIPRDLRARELAHNGIHNLIVVDTMHARKEAMAARADAFCTLPGGIGTLDETLEILTWRQLGFHAKPLVAAGPTGFWEPLFALLAHQRRSGFLPADTEAIVTHADSAAGVVRALGITPAA